MNKKRARRVTRGEGRKRKGGRRKEKRESKENILAEVMRRL